MKQLSSLRPGLEFFGFDAVSDSLRDRLVDLMVFYYSHLEAIESEYPQRVQRISNVDMRERLRESIEAAFATLGLPVDSEFAERLNAYTTQSKSHASSHEYSLEEFGLDAELIRSRFEGPTRS